MSAVASIAERIYSFPKKTNSHIEAQNEGIGEDRRLSERQSILEITDPVTIEVALEGMLSIRDQAYQSLDRDPIVKKGEVRGITFRYADDHESEVDPIRPLISGTVRSVKTGQRNTEMITFHFLNSEGEVAIAALRIEGSIRRDSQAISIDKVVCSVEATNEAAKIEISTGTDETPSARISSYANTGHRKLFSRHGHLSVGETVEELGRMKSAIQNQTVPVATLDVLMKRIIQVSQEEETRRHVPAKSEAELEREVILQRLCTIDERVNAAQLVLENYKDYLAQDSKKGELREALAIIRGYEEERVQLLAKIDSDMQRTGEVKPVAFEDEVHAGRHNYRVRRHFGREALLAAAHIKPTNIHILNGRALYRRPSHSVSRR